MLRLLAGKGTAWAAIGLGSTFFLAASEYMLTLILIMFLYVLKLVPAAKFPRWIVLDIGHTSPVTVLVVLVLVGGFRALFQLSSRHALHAMLELVRGRLKIVQGYRMLLRKGEHPVSQSLINMVMNEYIPKASDYVYFAVELASDLCLSFFLLLGMLFLAWKESLLGIACLGGFSLLLHKLNRDIKREAVHVPRERNVLERSLVRICHNWLLIRVMRIEEREYRSFVDSSLNYFRHSKRTFFYRNLAIVLPALFGIFSMALIVGMNIGYFHTPAVELVGFVYLFQAFSRNLMPIAEKIGLLSLYQPQFDMAVGIFSGLPAEELAAAVSPDKRFRLFESKRGSGAAAGMPLPTSGPLPAAASRPPGIVLEHLTYSWPDQAQPAIKDLSLKIPPGVRFGITGPNGCGKSTLLGLILGILTPAGGEVLVDGVPGGVIGRKDITVGYVSDDHFLIQGTIRDNLLYGAERDAGQAEIWDALRLVRLDRLVRTLPGGCDYPIQENEEGLSSGEKQRLALARAFLRRPGLLVLDEASANLDREAEAVLAEILGELSGRCTTIIVSHKPGILQGVERVFRMDGALNG
jgi:ABC-type multidrug transport system fused ATPase/permease subunit